MTGRATIATASALFVLSACGTLLSQSGDDPADRTPTADAEAEPDASTGPDANRPDDRTTTDAGEEDATKDGATGCASPPCERFVFVTSNAYSGDLGGLSGADVICNQLANLGDPRLKGRSFVAYLGNTNGGTAAAGSRLNAVGPAFKRIDGTVVAPSRDTFVNGPLSAPINVDDKHAGVTTEVNVWTGADIGGSVSGQDCTGWTVADAGTGTFGSATSVTSTYVNAGSTSCSETRRLYCIQP